MAKEDPLRLNERLGARVIVAALLLGLVLVGFQGHEARAEERGLVIVANQGVADSSLDRRTLANIFLNKKTTWSNRTSIELVVLKEGEVHERFLREYLGKSPRQYSDYWDRLVFTGAARVPRALSTEREIVSYVRSVPGAIGYVSSDSGVDLSGVKQIRVQG